MDNFRSNKSPRRRSNAIDGMITAGKSNRARIVNAPLKRSPKQLVPKKVPKTAVTQSRLDNFKAADGFHSVSQPTLRTAPVAKSQLGRKPRRNARGQIDMNLPPAAKRKAKSIRHWRKTILRSAICLTVIAVLLLGGIFGQAYWKSRHVLRGGSAGAAALDAEVDPTKLKGEGDGRINILLIGKGGPGHEGPDLTDTILIASIDPVQKQAALLSIPRDFYVKSDYGWTKINAVYANAKYAVTDRAAKQTDAIKQQGEDAGFAQIEKVVTQTMGIPIHYHVMVDFEAFRKAIDTVGGVTVDVKQQLYDPTVAWENNNNPLIAGVGLQNFNGKKALLYVRSRHGSARGDFDRAERQREVILALKSKVLSAGTLSNPTKLYGLISAFGDHVETNFNQAEAVRLYEIGKGIDASKVVSLGLADPPNDYVTTGASPDGQSIVMPKAGLGNYTAIQSYIRNTLKDSFLAKENATIAIFNGTQTPGLATAKSTDLKSYGYNILKTDNAPTRDYQKTVLVDLTKGTKKYTKHYLEQRLGVTAVTTVPDATIVTTGADFVIILGTDANSN
jgi:polyisoprenyl-teichoic acid--peptidoglycan teichoic acid transferase